MNSEPGSFAVSLFSLGRRLDLADDETVSCQHVVGAWSPDSQSAAGVSLGWLEDVSIRKHNALDGHQNRSVCAAGNSV